MLFVFLLTLTSTLTMTGFPISKLEVTEILLERGEGTLKGCMEEAVYISKDRHT